MTKVGVIDLSMSIPDLFANFGIEKYTEKFIAETDARVAKDLVWLSPDEAEAVANLVEMRLVSINKLVAIVRGVHEQAQDCSEQQPHEEVLPIPKLCARVEALEEALTLTPTVASVTQAVDLLVSDRLANIQYDLGCVTCELQQVKDIIGTGPFYDSQEEDDESITEAIVGTMRGSKLSDIPEATGCGEADLLTPAIDPKQQDFEMGETKRRGRKKKGRG